MIKWSSVKRFSDEGSTCVDIFVHALGFEQRACAILASGKVVAQRYISLQFPDEERFSYQINHGIAKNIGATIVRDYVEYFRGEFAAEVRGTEAVTNRKLNVTIDVSSMNRTMIATVLFAVISLRQHLDEVSLIYVPGVFHEPRSEFPAIERIGAVTPELSAFSANPELPIGVVMGLGYEYGLAVGLVNRLEPRLTVCFRAVGHDVRYEEACRKANLDFDFGGSNIQVGSYPILDPIAAYSYIENIIFGMTRNFRVVIVPLGPKIFAAIATLIAIQNIGSVAIWRVAAHMDVSDVTADVEFIQFGIDLSVSLPEHEMKRALALNNNSDWRLSS